MLFQHHLLGKIQRTERVQRQVIRELFVHAHAANTFLKTSSPVRILVFIVPNGSPVFSAISLWLSPSKYAISRAERCVGGIPWSAPRTLSIARALSASKARSGCTEST